MISWTAVQASTGEVLLDLPGVATSGTLSRMIGQGQRAGLSWSVVDAARTPGWRVALQPLRTLLVATLDDLPGRPVLWWGILDKITLGSGPTIQLDVDSGYGWLARNYVPKLEVFGPLEQTSIARMLGLDAIAATMHGTVIETPTKKLLDRRQWYKGSDDQTCLAALQNLMGLDGGPEFWLDARWDADGTFRVLPTVTPRVGRAKPGDSPAPFMLSRVEWTRTEDWQAGSGATICTASMPNQGSVRVQRTATSALISQGWLSVEDRWQSDATTTTALQADADSTLRRREHGTIQLNLECVLGDLPVGTPELQLGDDITLDLTNGDLPEAEWHGTARLVGWSADPDQISGELARVTPILVDLRED